MRSLVILEVKTLPEMQVYNMRTHVVECYVPVFPAVSCSWTSSEGDSKRFMCVCEREREKERERGEKEREIDIEIFKYT